MEENPFLGPFQFYDLGQTLLKKYDFLIPTAFTWDAISEQYQALLWAEGKLNSPPEGLRRYLSWLLGDKWVRRPGVSLLF